MIELFILKHWYHSIEAVQSIDETNTLRAAKQYVDSAGIIAKSPQTGQENEADNNKCDEGNAR